MNMVSFIIPCFNGEETIESCLRSILEQEVPKDYLIEVIVVDNNSTDRSLEIIRDKFLNRVKVIKEESQGRSQARNRGTREAVGEFLAFVDVDVCLEILWLKKILESGKLHGNWGVITSIIRKAKLKETWFENYRVRAHQTVNSLNTINRFVPYVNSAAILTKKSVCEEIDGFDNSFDYFEDMDFGRKIGVRNYTLIASNALVDCYFGLDWRTDYFSRCFKIGYMTNRFLVKWSTWGSARCLKEALLYYLTSISFVWKNFLRIDYTLFQTLCFFLNILGALYSWLKGVGDVVRTELDSSSWIKIYGHEKIQMVNIYDGRVRILRRTTK